MPTQDPAASESAAVANILAGGGDVGALARSVDWAATPLGRVSAWPQSLRTVVSVVFDSTFPMMLAWGPAYTQIYNDRFRPILGRTKHPALGKGTAETFAEAWHIVGPLFAQVMGGQGVGFDDMLVPLDRNGYLEECYFVYTYTPVRDESGGVGGLLVACTETTARVLAERRLEALRGLALAAAQAKHEDEAWRNAAAVLAGSGSDLPFALLYVLDRDGDTARRISPASSPWGPDRISIQHDGAIWPLRQVAATRLPQAVDDIAGRVGAHAGPVWPEPVHAATVVPIARPGLPKPYGFLVAGVSPRLPLDDKYRDFLSLVGDQIAAGVANARAFEEEKQRTTALVELDRQKTAFFSNVSHELRTPLTLILGPLLDALQTDGAVRADVRPSLESAHRSSLRLLKLVNTLLDFSRIEAGRMQARFESVDIGALTADLASAFRSAMEKAGLEFLTEVEAIDGPVYVDRHMWEQIVLNLVSNAFKFTFTGRVTVFVRARGSLVEAGVRDTGVGIPEAALPQVFDRFHRVDGTRGRTHEGTGIGLALVEELVRLHGGTIAVESRENHGTTFTVSIPTGSAHLPADSIVTARAAATASVDAAAYSEEALRWLAPSDVGGRDVPVAGAETTGGRVLVVDDNADMRDYLRRLLGQQWRVDTAADGLEAVRMAREFHPDVVITDVMMPDLDGFGLLRALRADVNLSRTPMIMLSARAGEEARLEGISAGADDYVVKPFSARDLLARVNVQVVKGRLRVFEQQQAARLNRLFAQAPMAIAVLKGAEHVFELANPQYADLVGRAVVGMPVREAFPELAGQGVFERLDQVRQTGTPYVGRSVRPSITRGDGPAAEDAAFDVVYQPVLDENGQVDSIVVIAHDVTELARARNDAEASNRLKDEFLATLSHELRTPLNAVLGYTQMLRGGVIAADRVPAVLETIERNARLQRQLVEDVLDVSRIITGKLRLDVQQVDVARVIGEAVETVMPAATAKGVRVQTMLDQSGVHVAGDPQRLQQVFWNLLSNAVKFTPRGGRVQVCLQQVHAHVELTVSDTGEGVAAEALPHLFDRFWQADRALSRSHGGLGLGLAISRHLVEAHGGKIEASSPGKGQGTTVRVELPRMILHAAPHQTVERAHPTLDVNLASTLALADLSGIRVLLVDDDVDAAQVAKGVLVASGAAVTTAATADDALRLLGVETFDVAILDIGMPLVDGYELLRRVREGGLGLNASIPAAALTAYARASDRTRSLQAGFQMHLGKPIEPAELAAAVHSMARRDST
jgi:signal transduction histidine kinase